ncbi:MAG: hypothetical protein NTY67_04355 [Cyanobacteria bacterium]|nr:hypothetical protein [Cyanobacteriota bacterium]
MLNHAELAELESSLLPALERHHLRLLAHGLRTLQQIAGRSRGPAPDQGAIADWVRAQPQIADDPAFAAAFSTQLGAAARHLAAIATTPGLALDLSLAELVAWARRQADARVAIIDPVRTPQGDPTP